MINFTKSISILALGAALVVTAPTDIPTPDNGFSLWADAKAGEIKKPSVTRKKLFEKARYKEALRRTDFQVIFDPDGEDTIVNDSLEIRVPIVISEDDPESAASVDVSLSYVDELGNLAPLETKRLRPGRWTHVAVVLDASVALSEGGNLNFTVTHNDTSVDMSLVPSSNVGEIVIAKVGKTKTYVDVILQEDGSYTVGIGGTPKDMGQYCADYKREGDLCLLSGIIRAVNGVPTGPAQVENLWASEIKGITYGELEGLTHFISATTYNEIGQELDRSTESGVLNEDETGRTTDELGYIDLGVNAEGGLEILVASEPIDPSASATLSANLKAEDFGVELINETDVPAISYREFAITDVPFIDFGSVVGLTYDYYIEVYDAFGNLRSSGELDGVIASESSEFLVQTGIVFDEPYEGPAPLELNAYGAIVQNDDGETFTVYFGFEGDAAKEAAQVILSVVPDDGGSEPDLETLTTTESQFYNAWDIPAPTGAEAGEYFLASETLSINLSMSSDGKRQDLLGGTDDGSNFRKPEPYKGKGVRYIETLRRKAGKAASK